MESLAQYSAALGYPYPYPRPPYGPAFPGFPPPPPGLAYGGAGAAGGPYPPMLPLGAFASYGVLPPPPPAFPPVPASAPSGAGAAASAPPPARPPQPDGFKKKQPAASDARSDSPPDRCLQMKMDRADRPDRVIAKTERVFVPCQPPEPAALPAEPEETEQSLYYKRVQEDVLIEKKLSLLQSPEVMKFIQKRQARLGQKTRASELFINRMKHSGSS